MKKSTKFFATAAVAFGLLAGSATTGSAITLATPDVSFDSSQGAGQNLFTTQGVHFDSASGYLAVSAKATSISYDGVSSSSLTNGTVDYRVLLTSTSSTSSVVTGTFGTDGVTGDDLLVSDNTGLLLSGNFIRYELSSIYSGLGSNPEQGYGDAVFLVTGGSLASYYVDSLNQGGIVHLQFNIAPSFTALSFSSDFDGKVKGDIAPVPEPSTLLLLGSGLVGAGFWFRRRAA